MTSEEIIVLGIMIVIVIFGVAIYKVLDNPRNQRRQDEQYINQGRMEASNNRNQETEGKFFDF